MGNFSLMLMKRLKSANDLPKKKKKSKEGRAKLISTITSLSFMRTHLWIFLNDLKVRVILIVEWER